MSHNTWIEVSSSALTHNLQELKNALKEGALIAPCVKANAYGHGLLETAKVLQKAGADWISCQTIDEMIHMKRAGITVPILILGHIPSDRLGELLQYKDVRIFVYNIETAQILSEKASAKGTILPIHIKVDTDMGRQGVTESQLPEFTKTITSLPNIKIEAVATHLASADEESDAHLNKQIQNFEKAIMLVSAKGNRLEMNNAANSAALLRHKKYSYDLARPGISVYGYYTSPFIQKITTADLKPALTWKTRVVQTKTIPKGSCVSYNCTYTVKKETRVAVLPVGYSDGLDRKLSNCGHVLIKGKRAPILGKVCMNLTVVDVSEIPDAGINDEVVILGKQESETITADEHAQLIETINYEIMSRLRESIPRKMVA